MSKIDLPTSLPGGMMLPHMSARARHEVCDVVFFMLGGTERLHHEANRDREAYWEFMKLWSKGLPRAVATEHSVGEGVETFLSKLDEMERLGETLDITPVEVSDAVEA